MHTRSYNKLDQLKTVTEIPEKETDKGLGVDGVHMEFIKCGSAYMQQ